MLDNDSTAIRSQNANGDEPGDSLSVALEYARREWSVLPLYSVEEGQCTCDNPNCENIGKHPIGRLVPHGPHNATTDEATIRRWWSAFPTANIGIALAQSELVIVGPDSPEWHERFRQQGLPETYTVQTGGGEGHLHYYYKRPEDCPTRRRCQSGEFDILADGYCVAAPSKHRSGRTYEALTPLPEELPEAPDWVVELLVEAKTSTAQPAQPIDPDEPPVRLEGVALERWHGRKLARTPDGKLDRSLTLFLIGRSLAQAGASQRAIFEALQDRDLRLWPEPKFANRQDAKIRYAEIADRALNPESVADVADVADFPEEAADGARILDDVLVFVRRFIAFPSDEAAYAFVLWAAHTHLIDLWDSTPRISFSSPEPGSGKTRNLEVLELLVPNPLMAVNISPAALFRKISDPDGIPTILLDEVDAIFGDKAREHEDLRSLLNSGHRKGASVLRVAAVGRTFQLEEFPSYCPVAMAGLGYLPDTLMSRTVVIHMRRRTASERVEPFRYSKAKDEGEELRDRLAFWARIVAPTIRALGEDLPPEVVDRAADCWEALIAVADAAGGDWPERARQAAVFFVNQEKETAPSIGVRLLTDIREIFGNDKQLSSAAIVERLCELPEAPWGTYFKGQPITKQWLAEKLKPYDIKSRDMRFGKSTLKGYRQEDFHDAWARYVHTGPTNEGLTPEADSSKEIGPTGDSVAEGVDTQPDPPPSTPEDAATSATSATLHGTCLDCKTPIPEGVVGFYCERHRDRVAHSGPDSVIVESTPQEVIHAIHEEL